MILHNFEIWKIDGKLVVKADEFYDKKEEIENER